MLIEKAVCIPYYLVFFFHHYNYFFNLICFCFIFSKLDNHLKFLYFEIQIFGVVTVLSFNIALALRKANFTFKSRLNFTRAH